MMQGISLFLVHDVKAHDTACDTISKTSAKQDGTKR